MKQSTFATQRNILFRGVLPFIFFGSFASLTSCEDDGATIGAGILPREEVVGVYNYNSHKIGTENFTLGRVQSDDVSYALVGQMNDPQFGPVTSDFFGELTLGSKVPNGSFKPFEGYYLDSAVVNFTYQKTWQVGDSLAKHDIKIFELTKPLDKLENYFSDTDLSGYYDPSAPIAQGIRSAKNFVKGSKEKTDSIWNIKNKELQWSFRLNNETAEKLFNLDKASLSSREAFKQAFNGILLTTEPIDPSTEGNLMRLNILNQKSAMTLYYSYARKDKYNNPIDTIHNSYSFYFNYESVRTNRFSNENDGFVPQGANAKFLYIQSLAGSCAKFKFPQEIYNWSDSINSVNNNGKAGISTVDLIFHIDTAFSKVRKYSIPSDLQIMQKNLKTGTFESPTFMNATGGYESAFIGGSVNQTNLTYHFRFTRGFFESVLANDNKIFDREFYLVPTNAKAAYSRVVLRSSEVIPNEEKDRSLKLDIKYVKFH